MKVKQKNFIREGERGNVLFLILIAVALFAALSYAVTQSTRSGGGDAGGETSLIGSAQITQYPASIRTSIMRMVIAGTDPRLLEFNSPSEFGFCSHDGADEKSRCVFHPDGGGATYVTAPPDVMSAGTSAPWSFNGENEIHLVGTSTGDNTVGDPSADIIAFLPDISPTICQKINESLGIAGTIPIETGIILFSSAMISETASPVGEDSDFLESGSTIGFDVPELDGQPFGCFQQPAGQYHYYHVLIER